MLSSYPNTNVSSCSIKNIYFVPPGQYAIAVYHTGTNSILQASVAVVPTGDVTMYGTTQLQHKRAIGFGLCQELWSFHPL